MDENPYRAPKHAAERSAGNWIKQTVIAWLALAISATAIVAAFILVLAVGFSLYYVWQIL